MSLLVWVVGAIASALIGLMLTVMFQDRVSGILAHIFRGSLFSSGDRDVSGTWWCYYAVSREPNTPPSKASQAILTVRLRQIGKKVVGLGVENSRDYFLVASLQDSYLTGTWNNCIDKRYSWGAFQLYALTNNRLMLGKFVGMNSHNFITHGVWLWAKSELGLHDAAKEAAGRGYIFDMSALNDHLPPQHERESGAA